MQVLLLLVVACSAVAGHADLVDLCRYHRSFCAATVFSSYSGYINVSRNSSMFYWYFVPNSPMLTPDTPLIMWLQGGPGASSMMGALFEIGPVTLDRSARLILRNDIKYNWAANVPVLFIDNPVGTGWSHVSDDHAFATSENDVARDMMTFLNHFALLHKEAPRRLIITGESYGGHYIPAIGVHVARNLTPFKLDGVAIGDSLTDPATQILTKPQAAFDFGLIDEQQLDEATNLAKAANRLVAGGDYLGALAKRKEMEEVVGNASAINSYDVRTTKSYSWMDDRMAMFFGLDAVKDMLHVPRAYKFGETKSDVEQHLAADVMRSQKGHVEALLNASIRVLLYQGQFDWKDGASSNEAWIRTLQWQGTSGYLTAPRSIWHRSEDSEIAGYWRGYQNLEQVVVLGAGHLVPMDAASSAFDMISRFVTRPAGGDRPGLIV